MIPFGFCQCGCGQKTTLARNTDKKTGYVKGQPRRFIFNHHMENKPIKADGYRNIQFGGRLEKVHRLRAELALGHPLPAGAIVHHADGTRSDTSVLVICPDVAYHKLLHVRMRILRAGGNPNTQRLCNLCKKPVNIELMESSGARLTHRCKSCSREYQRAKNR